MESNIEFIDLYAGIGGIRFGFEHAGAKCVFSSEWDEFSKLTYKAFHGETPHGDIHKIDISTIPKHNILTAGFPCQPFSLAGVSKKNSLGIKHGFEDPTQGTEFFKIKEILSIKNPDAFFLENVKNLKNHDNKKTFEIIEETLDVLGYHFKSRVIDSAFWVPQHRERIYILGFKKELELEDKIEGIFPELPEDRLFELDEVLIPQDEIIKKFADKYTLTLKTWQTLVRHKKNHAEKGNGFGYSLIMPPFKGKTTRTLSARYYKDGAEILVSQGRGKRPRRLTPLEACRLQGFPKECENFFNGGIKQPVSELQAYRQFGNSVSVPVIKAIAEKFVKVLSEKYEEINKLQLLQTQPLAV